MMVQINSNAKRGDRGRVESTIPPRKEIRIREGLVDEIN